MNGDEGSAPRFLCDEMLKGLARWLRAAGYDTAVPADGSSDRDLLQCARAEGRLLLTRDRKLLEHRGAVGAVLLLRCESLDRCAAVLSRALGLDWEYRPLSRCLRCNTELAEAEPALWARVPPRSRKRAGRLLHCPSCDQVFWDGSHVHRLLRRLAQWNGRAS